MSADPPGAALGAGGVGAGGAGSGPGAGSDAGLRARQAAGALPVVPGLRGALPAALSGLLAAEGLAAVGAFRPGQDDGLPADVGTVLLIGRGAGHWEIFAASPERRDGAPDPLDRWSRRVIDGVAAAIGGRAAYPFGGPPHLPFQAWARRGEGAMPSPVAMQASGTRGLWVAYRGALLLRERLAVTPPPPAPCAPCPAPCRSACPVNALGPGRYDIAACVAHLVRREGARCREEGCAARRACPAGRAAEPPAAERRFHMAAFLAARTESPCAP